MGSWTFTLVLTQQRSVHKQGYLAGLVFWMMTTEQLRATSWQQSHKILMQIFLGLH